MTEQNLQSTEKKSVALKELYSMCQDDEWLMDFISDTEKQWMVKAPSHMKEETFARLLSAPSPLTCKHPLSLSATKTAKEGCFMPNKGARNSMSKRMELFLYSLRVSAAAMGAIIVLFLTPSSLERLHTTFSDSVIEFSNVFYQMEVVPND